MGRLKYVNRNSEFQPRRQCRGNRAIARFMQGSLAIVPESRQFISQNRDLSATRQRLHFTLSQRHHAANESTGVNHET
ncbi:hypothetical protein [Paraburkholderia youngii]|uniref:hypothetical protein n=1 Tax=Paraburkholderia youngii TaxID=2782701 RepID=UPI003D1CA79D